MIPGTIALVHFPFSSRETTPYKRRPVLVLADDGVPPNQAIFCVMITGNARRIVSPGPGDILIPDWRESGLTAPSVVRTRRIWTAELRDFDGELGLVSQQIVGEVRTAVARLLRLAPAPL